MNCWYENRRLLQRACLAVTAVCAWMALAGSPKPAVDEAEYQAIMAEEAAQVGALQDKFDALATPA